MHSTGVLGRSVARSETDKFVKKDSKQTIMILVAFCKILNGPSNEINLFRHCSSLLK